MPVFNAERWLKQAVDSILEQTFTDFEFLIIDDGSTDNSLNILESYDDSRINLVINPENRGLINSLNHGLSLAKGEYIARMDADDISLPDRLSTQYGLMSEQLDTVVCSSNAEQIDHNQQPLGEMILPSNDPEIKTMLRFRCPLIHPASFFRKAAARQAGGYEPKDIDAEDFGLWLRLSSLGKFTNIQKILLQYRIHENNVSSQPSSRQGNNAFRLSYNALNEAMDGQLDENSYRRFWFYWVKNNGVPGIRAISKLNNMFAFASSLPCSENILFTHWRKVGLKLTGEGHLLTGLYLESVLKKYSGLGYPKKYTAIKQGMKKILLYPFKPS